MAQGGGRRRGRGARGARARPGGGHGHVHRLLHHAGRAGDRLRLLARHARHGVRRHGGNSLSGPGVPFIAGDAMRLPFADEVFDAVTISVALRNVHDTSQALREMLRVTKPGGRLVILEFSHVTFGPFDLVYREYLMRLLPQVAKVFGSNDDSYEYLAESIRDWPDQPTLARTIQEAGWERVAWRNLTMGIVAMHRGFKPA
ncbi:class I SAM-dependent methyltransferase [Nonomuraea rubra]|uniref:class I SAM-dependent methyltransferase n=1 Tax=Nonomuraea rubra TaxID=46180 RepID=UPI003617E39C